MEQTGSKGVRVVKMYWGGAVLLKIEKKLKLFYFYAHKAFRLFPFPSYGVSHTRSSRLVSFLSLFLSGQSVVLSIEFELNKYI